MGLHLLSYAKSMNNATETTLSELNGDTYVPPLNGAGQPLPLVGIMTRLEGGAALDYVLIDSNRWADGHEIKFGDLQNQLLETYRELVPSETLSVKAKQSTGAAKRMFVGLLVKTRDPEIAPIKGANIFAKQVSVTAGDAAWGSTPGYIGPGQTISLLPDHRYALVGIHADEGIVKVEAPSFGSSRPGAVAGDKPYFFPVWLPFSGSETLKIYVAGAGASVLVDLYFADLGPTGVTAPPVARRPTPTLPGMSGGLLGALLGGLKPQRMPL